MVYDIVTDVFLEQFKKDGIKEEVENAIKEMQKLTHGEAVKVAQNGETKTCLQKEYLFNIDEKEIKIIFIKNGGSLYAAVIK